jgi:hypothetical protein
VTPPFMADHKDSGVQHVPKSGQLAGGNNTRKRMETGKPSRTGRSDEEARSSGSWLWAGSAQPEILTIRDLAAHLRVPVSTAYRLAQQRQLPGRKSDASPQKRSNVSPTTRERRFRTAYGKEGRPVA